MAESLPTLAAKDDAHKIVQSIVGAVQTLTRWKPSRWNGTIYVATAPGRIDGARRSWRLEPGRWFDGDAVIANPDGSMTIRRDALEWTRNAWAGKLKHKNNFKAHQAILGMVSAAVELNRNPDPGPGASHDEDPASKVLTLGLTRDFARRHTGEIIVVTGLNDNDRLLDINPVVNTDLHASSAAARFTEGLAESGFANMPVGELRRQLIGTAPAERWNWIADGLMKAHLAGRDILPENRRDLRERLADLAHDNYAEVAGIPARIAGMRPEPALRPRHRIDQATKLGETLANHTLTQLAVKNWGSAITLESDHPAIDEVRDAADRLRVPVEKLRSLIDDANAPAGSPPRDGADAPQGRPVAGADRRSEPGTSL